jgi:GNAT superfamily N-acetyltransferase
MPFLRTAHPGEPAARPLVDGLAEEYERLYGARAAGELHARAAADFLPPHGVLLLLVDGSETVAGGGLAPLAAGVAEVKRMWTSPRHRRHGFARMILQALELEARDLGYHELRLQTGALQAPALALYRAAGYRPAPPFGRYRDEPLARAFEKGLAGPPPQLAALVLERTASRRLGP